MKSGCPDPDKAADLPEFIAALGRLRLWAGSPSFRELAKRVGPLLCPPQPVAQSTIGDVFQIRRRRLDLDLVVAIVRALGLEEPEVARWRDACVTVHDVASSAGRAGKFRQLPADLATFTGREPELRAMLGAIDSAIDGVAPGTSTVVISAIDGMAGIGKSALAVRAAHRVSDRFPDGQLFLDLYGHTQGMTPREPADALAALLGSLGVPPAKIPAEPDARAAAYRARLAGTRTLILLDNAATEAQIRPLIPGQAGCLVLITSRRRLKALDAAHAVALDVLPERDAVALLQALVEPLRAPAQDPGWARIADLCGCLPLALRIAAALIRHRPAWTLGHLADRLRAAPLDLGAFTDGERDLSAVFDLSYQALTDDQRGLLRRLGLIPGPDIDVYAAAALSGGEPARTERLLQGLVDHHLLTEPAAGRYRMHDLIRAYARAQAMARDSEPERDGPLNRLLHYYAHTAQSASPAVTRFPRPAPSGPSPAHAPDLRDSDDARAWLRAEQPNLDAAFTHARTHGLDGHTVALAAGLADILHTDGPWTRGLDVHRRAAEAAQRLGRPALHAAALTDLGRLRNQIGDYAGADDALTRAREIHREIGDPGGEADALTELGRGRYRTGDFAGADEPLTRALKLSREIGNRGGEAYALAALGRVRSLSSDYPGADSAFTQALEIYREIGNRSGEAHALAALGRVRLHTGDFPGAVDAHTRALELYRGLGSRTGEADALTELGRVRSQTGDFAGAADAQTRALAIYREIGSRSGEAYALSDLGCVRYQTGDYAEAADAQTRALEIYREIGDRTGEAIALGELGRLHHRTGDRSEAGDAHTRALKIYREIGNRNGEAIMLSELGRLHHQSGDYSEADDAHTSALAILRETGARGNEAWALNHYAATVAASGDRTRALALYRRALAMNRELNKPDDEAVSLEGIADHHLTAGETSQGTTKLRQALAIYQRLGMSVEVARVQTRIAELSAE